MERGPRPEQHEKKLPRMEVATRASEKHPDRNEDSFFVSPEHGVAGVFDGAGKIAGAKEASKIAAEVIFTNLSELPKGATLEDVKRFMREALRDADGHIKHRQLLDEKHKDMATTASVIKLWENDRGRKVVIGNVGDSRVYLHHEDGRLDRLTVDDSSALMEVCGFDIDLHPTKALRILQKLDSAVSSSELTDEEYRVFKKRNVLGQALGAHIPLKPRIFETDLPPGAKLLLTSDGISDNLTHGEIAACLNEASSDTRAAADLLIKAAHMRSEELTMRSKPDDMTAIMVRF